MPASYLFGTFLCRLGFLKVKTTSFFPPPPIWNSQRRQQHSSPAGPETWTFCQAPQLELQDWPRWSRPGEQRCFGCGERVPGVTLGAAERAAHPSAPPFHRHCLPSASRAGGATAVPVVVSWPGLRLKCARSVVFGVLPPFLLNVTERNVRSFMSWPNHSTKSRDREKALFWCWVFPLAKFQKPSGSKLKVL